MRLYVAVAALALFIAPAAAASDVDACASASERAQDLRAGGKLRAAREQLLACVRPECPPIIQTDCGTWLAEVDRSLPSVVVSATDPEGRDAIAVRVIADGALLAERLDGKAIAIDPGVHVLRYEYAGSPPVEERVLAREGEKNRALQVRFKRAGPGRPVERPVEGSRAAPVPSLVLGGVGLVALATFAFFAISGQSDYDACVHDRATCTQRDVDTISVKRDAAYVAAGVSVIALGVATWLYLTAR